ncbi:MAG TPA: hypothetical protein VFC10_09910 [Terriglobia bacterium]|jgi:hypothetical protein|nr:hypothetical protein [Terriglobia bacterium]
MAQGAKFHEQPISRPEQRAADDAEPSFGSKVKLVIRRAVFWSYERGSWQYDIIVLLILAFIFLTPRSWFHDRPVLQLSDLRHIQGIIEVSHTDRVWTYQLDARLVESLGGVPLRDAVRQLLVPRIKTPFEIVSVKPILGNGGVVLGYTVEVKR